MVGPSREYMTADDAALFSDWIPAGPWTSSMADAQALLDIARTSKARAAVLDDYRVDNVYQAILKQAGMPWLQFDGFANKPLWADIIVNANPAIQLDDYKKLVRNRQTTLLLGPKYAVLRPEFSRVKQRERSTPVRKALVTFGGGDDRGAILFTLATLVPLIAKSVHFLVVSGKHNPRNAEINAWIETQGQGRVTLAVNPQSMAPLFARCDLAIMAGGTSTYEAAACGLPMLLMPIADNQLSQSKAWDSCGAALFLGTFPEIDAGLLARHFLQLVEDEEKRYTMSRQARQLVDGKGAARVAGVIAGL